MFQFVVLVRNTVCWKVFWWCQREHVVPKWLKIRRRQRRANETRNQSWISTSWHIIKHREITLVQERCGVFCTSVAAVVQRISMRGGGGRLRHCPKTVWAVSVCFLCVESRTDGTFKQSDIATLEWFCCHQTTSFADKMFYHFRVSSHVLCQQDFKSFSCDFFYCCSSASIVSERIL